MKRKTPSIKIIALLATLFLILSTATPTLASLTNSLCGYWPFDNIAGCNNQTPDVIHGYNLSMGYGNANGSSYQFTNFVGSYMYLTNDSIHGQALFYDGEAAMTNGGGNNYHFMAYISANTNDLVPCMRHSPGSNTVSYWIKSAATNNASSVLWPQANSDQRVWCDTSWEKVDAAVLDLSPVGNSFTMFSRQNGPGGDPNQPGNFDGGSHTAGAAIVLTNPATWVNVTLESIPVVGGTNAATWACFINGVQDTTFTHSKGEGQWVLDTVGIFALCRQSSVAGVVTNKVIMDDLAEWGRCLSTNEILDYMANGITNAVGGQSALTVAFASDIYTTVPGKNVVLSWNFNSDATDASIDNGVGDVFSLSTCGVGSTTVAVSSTTTYTITVTRGIQTAQNSVTVLVVSGVNPGWNILGWFNDQPVGVLANQGNWTSLFSSPETATYGAAMVESTITGNHVCGLAVSPATSSAVLSVANMGNHSITPGGSNTLFFRFELDPSANTYDAINGVYPDIDVGMGVGDNILFDVVDWCGPSSTSTSGKGPAVRVVRATAGAGGPIDLTADWGPGTTSGFSWISSVDTAGLATGVVYNVWIDIYNAGNTNTVASSYYNVTVQVGGDAGTIQNLWTGLQPSDRATNCFEPINKAFIAANKFITGQYTNNVLMDDFFVSGDPFTRTYPDSQSSFVLGTPNVPTSIDITSVTRSGTSVTLNWTPTPSGSYTFSVLSKSALNSGSWVIQQSGISANTVTLTGQTAPNTFYRVTSP